MRYWMNWLCILALVLGTGTCSEGGSRTGNAIDVPLAMDTIGPEGGTIRVDVPGNPLDGAELVVPENALDEEVEISLLWSLTPIFPEYSAASHSFSAVLKIKPEELAFAIPSTLGMPTSIPEGSVDATPVTFGISKQLDLFEHTIPVDNDFSDSFGSLSAAHGGAYAFGGFVVDASVSSILIVQPPLDMGSHTVTAGSSDPIEIHLNLLGRGPAGNELDLDEAVANSDLPLQISGMPTFPVNIQMELMNMTSMNAILAQSALGQLAFDTDHFEYNTTAGSISPTIATGNLELDAVLQVNLGVGSFLGTCTGSNPLCAAYLSLPEDPFVSVP